MYRIIRLLKALLGASAFAVAPVKTLAVLVASLVIPYLIYAFAGGFILAVIIGLTIWGIYTLSRRKTH